jgi:hypothetical protein
VTNPEVSKTYFQNVGLKAMAAAETVVRSASSDLANWAILDATY